MNSREVEVDRGKGSDPKDHSATATVGGIRVARTFSNVVSPPVIFALLGLALSLYELPLVPGLVWAAIYGFWVSLMPILVVVYLLKTGRISDLHMNTARERRVPYVASVVGAAVALILILLFDGPDLLRCLAIYSILVLTVLAIINAFWLISIHTASIAAATLILGLVYGLWAALLMLPLVILVVSARLYLRRHTVSQVVAGLALGIVSVVATAATGCFA